MDTEHPEVGSFSPAAPGTSMDEPPRLLSDPRDRLTPHAFVVAPELLGLPLASPGRRLAAWMADGALILLLAEAGPVFFGLAASAVFFRIATRAGSGGWVRRTLRWSAAALGAFVVFLSVLVLVDRTGAWDDEEIHGGAGAVDWVRFSQEVGSADPAAQAAAAQRLEAAFDRPDPLPTAVAPGVTVETDGVVSAAGAPEDPNAAELARLRAERRRLLDENAELAEQAENPGLKRIATALAADLGLSFGWFGVYMTLFPAWWRGLTPGKRLFGIRILAVSGRPLSIWSSFERCGGYAAGVATGFLGFLQVYWDPNRQGVHDKIAGTVVIRNR